MVQKPALHRLLEFGETGSPRFARESAGTLIIFSTLWGSRNLPPIVSSTNDHSASFARLDFLVTATYENLQMIKGVIMQLALGSWNTRNDHNCLSSPMGRNRRLS